jgi:hypothetical protein
MADKGTDRMITLKCLILPSSGSWQMDASISQENIFPLSSQLK